MIEDEYLKGLKANRDNFHQYYSKSIENKTEQQKLLEKLLEDKGEFAHIADLACGYGTVSFHLSKLYPGSHFYLADYNEEALGKARLQNPSANFSFYMESIYDLSFQDNFFDLVVCWQTLSFIDKPQIAMREMIRITKPGGRIFVSSLFNKNFDVDLYTKAFDYTTNAGRQGIGFSYNTYSQFSINQWIKGLVSEYEIIDFIPEIDFVYDGRGVGTFTINSENKRLQISANMLMNWGILSIVK
ncbi:MAG TPA: class I SAM-dependent methyltransferase [Nitrosopumilaceae archaeon]|nr:class I SAM-dependent methyltransferase [Nitrosopumilaceae archaeon]